VADGVEFFLNNTLILHPPGMKRVAMQDCFRFKFAPFTNECGNLCGCPSPSCRICIEYALLIRMGNFDL
jgi:hypothetical protein